MLGRNLERLITRVDSLYEGNAITASDVARMLGIDKRVFSRWVSSRFVPEIQAVDDLVKLLKRARSITLVRLEGGGRRTRVFHVQD